MDKVRLDELKRYNDNEEYKTQIAKLDAIIAKGSYVTTNDLFDQDDLLGE